MSAEAVTVVLHHSKSEGTAKLVLWGIANHHSDAGSWPSIATLAKYAAVSERRVQQILRELVQLGEIAIEEQGGLGQGQYKTNRFHILISCPADCDGSLNHKTGVKSGAVRGEIYGQSGVKPVSPEPNIELNIEIESVKRTRELEEKFKEFWKEYPKRTDKRAAEKAFRSALTRASFEDILAGAIKYANDPNLPETRYIKNPATWLNADAWENPPLPPRKKNRESEKEAEKRRLEEWIKQFETEEGK
ncbi:MAG: helix-turn-helix domain-containing protein [Actinobacteria bacterium]|nr:helix-turn-helix domain-containing protein [Actinomycetota bacterium]